MSSSLARYFSFSQPATQHMPDADSDTGESWVAWEPPEYVAARGPSLQLESAHFVVRWGGDGPSSARAAAAARPLLAWLEQTWALLCDPASPDHFVTPYTTPGWSDDGLRRKLNVYIGDTGLHPHPHDAGWAHQGTWVEAPVEAVRHAAANPQAKLHHSFLALKPGAAESERTVVHELAHVLQMHTGGHVDSPLVGCVVRRGGVGGGGAACSRLLLAWAGTSGRRTPSTARTCAAPPGRLTCPSSSARPTSAST